MQNTVLPTLRHSMMPTITASDTPESLSLLILDRVEVPPEVPEGVWVMMRKTVDPFVSFRSIEGVAVIDGAERYRSREAGIQTSRMRGQSANAGCGVKGNAVRTFAANPCRSYM